MSDRTRRWDVRFLRLAREVASWSKDPTTGVGAVIVDNKQRVVSLGYNGFPRGMSDAPTLLEDRESKLALTIHAEENAMLFATRDLDGCTVYTYPVPPCSNCAAKLVQDGVARVVTIQPDPEFETRWTKSLMMAQRIYREKQILFRTYRMEDIEDETATSNPDAGVRDY